MQWRHGQIRQKGEEEGSLGCPVHSEGSFNPSLPVLPSFCPRAVIWCPWTLRIRGFSFSPVLVTWRPVTITLFKQNTRKIVVSELSSAQQVKRAPLDNGSLDKLWIDNPGLSTAPNPHLLQKRHSTEKFLL